MGACRRAWMVWKGVWFVPLLDGDRASYGAANAWGPKLRLYESCEPRRVFYYYTLKLLVLVVLAKAITKDLYLRRVPKDNDGGYTSYKPIAKKSLSSPVPPIPSLVTIGSL
ncbi:hypothetical protein SODALDRAFT_350103 [Sodiomyces alkalinus F11]|uniref:Uncharacterized protein n=1 Tax=Sodiomyces alkalinus (strain CBS 110278 / VKM F-3762 / F11) TaxID=1314773 RepID=A0A3N2PZW9_SODAK|nr:hypothetical protein SODALDRAFT_350103 [Sodiomyces alkalinus F11]ROT40047.1 hypothetical protein SODALDRAFT_350103 [Sodiomyces alkalinus F11]